MVYTKCVYFNLLAIHCTHLRVLFHKNAIAVGICIPKFSVQTSFASTIRSSLNLTFVSTIRSFYVIQLQRSMSENLNIDFHLHFKKSQPLKSKCWKEREIDKNLSTRGRGILWSLNFVVCEHRQNGAPEWQILLHTRQRFLGTDQLSLFIEALVIVLPFNVGIDVINSFCFDFQNSIQNSIIQISS